MAVSNADILGWLNENPGADDTLIATTMQAAGVSPEQMAQATGLNYGDVSSRYNTALGITSLPAAAAPVTQEVDYFAQQFTPDVYTPTTTTTATTSAPVTTVEDLYREVLGREPDAEGLAFWQQGFGGSVDAAEKASFLQAAQAELANRPAAEQVLLAPKIVDTSATGVTDADILGWFEANPGADDALIAKTMREAAVTPEQLARATNTNVADVQSRYDAALAGATQTQTQTTTDTTTQAANTVAYHDGTTYNATDLNTLATQISNLSTALGVDKSWGGGALNAGDNANIGFDADTGKKILGTDTITNKQQIALDMAANLNNAGIKSLDQIGMGNITGDVNVRNEYDENGNPTGAFSKWDVVKGDWTPMTADEIANIRIVDEGTGEGASQKLVTTGVTGTGLINKTNGKAIGDGSGNIGYTATGDGGTEYKLKIDEKTGLPIFYTVGVSSNDLVNLMADLGPIAQIGLAIATGGLSIPQQIAAQMAVGVLSGKEFDDVIKSAVISFAGAQIPGMDFMSDGASFIKDLGLSPELTKALTTSFQNAAVSAGTALLSGQDIGEAMLRGAVTGGVNGAVNSH